MAFSHLIFSFLAAFPSEISAQFLYLLHRAETEKAFHVYMEEAKSSQCQDFELLGSACGRLLEQGIQNKDPEIQLMSLFGAGVSTSRELIPVLERGIFSDNPKSQLVAINYLSRLNDDDADTLLLSALSSPFLLARLEALAALSKKNHPEVLEHLKALMLKIPDKVRFIFPQIAVQLDGPHARSFFRQLLNDEDPEVRIESILAAAKEGRDEFLPQIRGAATQPHFAIQEAAFLALGELKDQHAASFLESFLTNSRPELKLSSSISLFKLGKKEALKTIEEQAQGGSLFAISALGKLREGKELLQKLSQHIDRDIRLNAALALLEMHLPEPITTFLLDRRDLGFIKVGSASGWLIAWKAIPSGSQQNKKYPSIKSQTRIFKEKALIKCLECEEEEFFKIVDCIMENPHLDLMPLLMELLVNKKNEKSIQLLKKSLTHNSLWVRLYANLALYRMKEEGPYEEELLKWMKKTKDHPLIQFNENEEETKVDLAPDETSRLLVEVVETLASSRKPAAIEALLHAIAYGNPKNRYALAGLLIKATE